MTFCIIITLLILNYIKIYSCNNIFRWPRSKLSWAPKEERGTKAPFVNTFGSTHPLQSSNKKIPLNCHQLVFLTWFALPMIVWQSTMESFFFLSRQLRRLRLRRRRRCTFRENLHCVKAAWILSISELYLAAVQCTHCTQEFHTLLIYVISYWDRW